MSPSEATVASNRCELAAPSRHLVVLAANLWKRYHLTPTQFAVAPRQELLELKGVGPAVIKEWRRIDALKRTGFPKLDDPKRYHAPTWVVRERSRAILLHAAEVACQAARQSASELDSWTLRRIIDTAREIDERRPVAELLILAAGQVLSEDAGGKS